MKMSPVKTRIAWTPEHVDQLLALYFAFLANQQTGTAYQKAASVRELAAKQGRSKGSVEAKMMNVSAVLDQQGREWVQGYKPLSNFNGALQQQVMDYIAKGEGAAA